MPQDYSPVRAGMVAIVCADGIDAPGGIERFIGYLTQAFGEDASALPWFIQRTRFQRGAAGHLTTPLALAQFAWRCATGKVALAHINVAPRGSTFRKMAFAAVARASGTPVLIHLHGSGYDAFYDHCPRAAQRLIGRFFRNAGRVAVLGRYWSRFASERLGVAAERLLIIENGVPEPAVIARPENATAHIVFAGQLGERKGVDVLIDALAAIDADTPNWRATVAGGGETEVYARQAERAGIGRKISFPGPLGEEQVGQLLASGDIFVLPSRAENQPMAILEAMARGLPVISTRVGAIPEQVEDGVSGLVVSPGEPAELAHALARLIGRPGERAEMGRAGRARYQARYSIRRCSDSFRQAYHDMLPARAWGGRRQG